MAIGTFAQLKQKMNQFSKRTDLSDVIDDLVLLAEMRIDSELRVRTNSNRATATLSTSDRFLALPDRFSEMRRFTILVNQDYYDIHYATPEAMRIYGQAGIPKYFTVTSQIELDRTASDTFTVEMSYFSKLNPLSDSNTTNNILTDHPQIYLYGCLHEVALYVKDFEDAERMNFKFKSLIEEVNIKDERGRYGPAPRIMREGATP